MTPDIGTLNIFFPWSAINSIFSFSRAQDLREKKQNNEPVNIVTRSYYRNTEVLRVAYSALVK